MLLLERLENRRLLAVSLDDGLLSITGSPARDVVQLEKTSGQIVLTFNGQPATFDLAQVRSVVADLGAGRDSFYAAGLPIGCTVMGGDGNDILTGSDAADLLSGGRGHDTVSAGEGDDTLIGGSGDDQLKGDSGNDIFSGGSGQDTVLSDAGGDQVDNAETVTPIDCWVPADLLEQHLDLRAKTVGGTSYAVLDFTFPDSSYHATVSAPAPDGRTFRITVTLERWTGGAYPVITRKLRTVSLGELPPDHYQVLVQRPDGTIIDRQRFEVPA